MEIVLLTKYIKLNKSKRAYNLTKNKTNNQKLQLCLIPNISTLVVFFLKYIKINIKSTANLSKIVDKILGSLKARQCQQFTFN